MEQIAKQLPGPGADLTTKELRELGAGRELGRYTLLRRIATGGMAEVYVARSKGISGFEKKVAIKKILPQHSHNSRFIDMLVDEAKITVSLTHPNIAQVYELGLDGEDTYFIVMEYVDGRPLNKLMQRVDERQIMTIPLVHAVHIMSEVSKGLDHAHKQKDQRGAPLCIVHRDISPQNVLISYQGDVKLIDFGIARAEGRAAQTSQGVIKGKLRYLAPEIAAGEEPDHRADVFCCGIVLFEMLTGEAMFAPKSDLEAIAMASEARVRSPRSRNPNVPQDLDDICMRALRRDRNDRFQSAKDLHMELRRFLNQSYPAFVGSELGDFMQQMFGAEIAHERKADAIAEKVAQEGSVDFPAEEEPTMSGSAEDFISAAVESRKVKPYKQLVTRVAIAAEPRAPSGANAAEMRLIGADGGQPMGIVLDDGRRPRLQSEAGFAKYPGTMPPQLRVDWDRAPEPIVYNTAGSSDPTRSHAISDAELSVVPTITGPSPLLEAGLAKGPSWHDPSNPPSTEDSIVAWEGPGSARGLVQARTTSLRIHEVAEDSIDPTDSAPTRYTPGVYSDGRPFSGPVSDPGAGSFRDRSRSVERRGSVSVRTGPAWGYIFAFVAVAVLGGSLIFAGLSPAPVDNPIIIPPRNAHVKGPIALQPIEVEFEESRGEAVASGDVTVRVSPDVAVFVELDGKKLGEQRSPIVLERLTPRKHRLRISADGYRTEELSRVFDPGSEIEINLREELGTIHVRGVASAAITTDKGRVEGLSIVDIPLDTTVTVKVDRPGQKTWIEEVEVASNEPVEIVPPSPRNVAKGTLVVNARPVSMVYIDGKKKGLTPVKLKLPPGRHKVTLKGPDGEKRTTTKVVAPNKTTTFVYRWPK